MARMDGVIFDENAGGVITSFDVVVNKVTADLQELFGHINETIKTSDEDELYKLLKTSDFLEPMYTDSDSESPQAQMEAREEIKDALGCIDDAVDRYVTRKVKAEINRRAYNRALQDIQGKKQPHQKDRLAFNLIGNVCPAIGKNMLNISESRLKSLEEFEYEYAYNIVCLIKGAHTRREAAMDILDIFPHLEDFIAEKTSRQPTKASRLAHFEVFDSADLKLFKADLARLCDPMLHSTEWENGVFTGSDDDLFALVREFYGLPPVQDEVSNVIPFLNVQENSENTEATPSIEELREKRREEWKKRNEARKDLLKQLNEKEEEVVKAKAKLTSISEKLSKKTASEVTPSNSAELTDEQREALEELRRKRREEWRKRKEERIKQQPQEKSHFAKEEKTASTPEAQAEEVTPLELEKLNQDIDLAVKETDEEKPVEISAEPQAEEKSEMAESLDEPPQTEAQKQKTSKLLGLFNELSGK